MMYILFRWYVDKLDIGGVGDQDHVGRGGRVKDLELFVGFING